MESQPQNSEFKNNPENFHPCRFIRAMATHISDKFQNHTNFNIPAVFVFLYTLFVVRRVPLVTVSPRGVYAPALLADVFPPVKPTFPLLEISPENMHSSNTY